MTVEPTSSPTPGRSPHQAEQALVQLHRALGSKMLTGGEQLEQYRSDDSRIEGPVPDAVVLAESTEDLQTALRIAHETGVPITPRAGGTGRTGGAVPIAGGIVLSTERMNRIVDLDREEGVAVVQPGVPLAALHDAAEAEGWFYPPDPGSSDTCCISGNAATNAAGPRAFKYGATGAYVLGIDAVLPGGERFFSGRRTRKGVTGYDTTALLVGSEGTLAAFGDLTMRLVPRPEQVMTLLALFADMRAASEAVQNIIKARLIPRCIEFLDRKTLDVMRAAGNPLDPAAGAFLLIEVDGAEEECERQAERVGEACDEAAALSILVAQSATQRNKLWESRKQMSLAVRSRARAKISEDVVVPRMRLGDMLARVEQLGEQHSIDALAYGHAGDGNLHVNFLYDDEEQKRRVDLAVAELFQATVDMGGTLSGEHGIGLLKMPYMRLEQPPAQLALQAQLKRAFDPRGILNPGKVLPSGVSAPR